MGDAEWKLRSAENDGANGAVRDRGDVTAGLAGPELGAQGSESGSLIGVRRGRWGGGVCGD